MPISSSLSKEVRKGAAAILLAVAAALILASAESAQMTLGAAAWSQDTWAYRFGHVLLPWFLAAMLTPVIGWLVRRWPLNRRAITPWLVHATAAVAWGVLHLTLLAAIHAAFRMVDVGFREQARRLIANYTFQDFLIYWAVCGTFHAITFFDESRRRELASAQLQSSLARTQFHALQAQLRPHFLFNTLNSVATMARLGDNDAVVAMLARLGELLRRLLRESPENEIRLEEEVGYVRHFVAIEQLRFDDGIQLEIDMAPGTPDALVPNFLLQPLVENAFRHGFAMRPADAVIRVSARVDAESLLIEVEDNGSGVVGGAGTGHGLGLRLTGDRLEAAYGAGASLGLSSAHPTGTVATIRMPYRSSAHLVSHASMATAR